VRALRETARSGPSKARIAAIQTLGDLALAPVAAHRDMAKPAIPELVEALHDQDDDIRMWAAITLGQIGPSAGSAVESLISMLQVEENTQVILCAVRSLGEIGPGARPALPALTAIAEDSRHFARGFATKAIRQVNPQTDEAHPPAAENGPR
jgi:HEAT repeat protein